MVQRKASPYSGFNFTVELGDVVVGGFEEIDGLGTPDTVAPARVPGLHKHTNLNMKRGILGAAVFRVWRLALEKSRPVQGTMKIVSHDKVIQSQQAWIFTNVFPKKIEAPDLKSEANDISVETLEITAEGVAQEKECDH
jgi:phage tail-like protein